MKINKKLKKMLESIQNEYLGENYIPYHQYDENNPYLQVIVDLIEENQRLKKRLNSYEDQFRNLASEFIESKEYAMIIKEKHSKGKKC